MPSIKRSQGFAIRSAIHEVEKLIGKTDKSQLAEYERDLAAEACMQLWYLDLRHLFSCLRRLITSPTRGTEWTKVQDLCLKIFNH